MASKCSYRKQRGGESQAAMMGKIPQSITEQGMNFQRMTSTFHRSRKQKQRGGALTPAPYESLGEVLPSSMTGPMTTAASGVLGGSATAPLDAALAGTRQAVQQFGGGYRSRKQQNRKQKNRSRKQQNRNRQQQNRNRQQQNRNRNRSQKNRSRKQKQRGGAHVLGSAPAVPASGDYSILSPQELKAAGLNPQFFDENLVNPNFGGALTVPGGK